MGDRLTKRDGWRKGAVLVGVLGLSSPWTATAQDPQQDLRDCVAAARDARGVAACEKGQQAVLRDRIERWTSALSTELDARQNALLQRNSRSWQAFFDSELALLEVSLQRRNDGMGAALKPGAVTRLLEERERQLREHLQNIKHGQAAPAR
ncbi:MAG: hypothetical protein KDI82_04495 [Gammaproteobacteria bacterium]|nr:hypothetical protein [Gammaproteobacteria bacterium]